MNERAHRPLTDWEWRERESRRADYLLGLMDETPGADERDRPRRGRLSVELVACRSCGAWFETRPDWCPRCLVQPFDGRLKVVEL